jgi:hypothetical protein
MRDAKGAIDRSATHWHGSGGQGDAKQFDAARAALNQPT